MSICKFYKQRTEVLPSGEIHSHQQNVNITIQPKWCTHKHSPVSSPRVLGAGTLLTCGGDLAKCQVPKDKFDDAY